MVHSRRELKVITSLSAWPEKWKFVRLMDSRNAGKNHSQAELFSSYVKMLINSSMHPSLLYFHASPLFLTQLKMKKMNE